MSRLKSLAATGSPMLAPAGVFSATKRVVLSPSMNSGGPVRRRAAAPSSSPPRGGGGGGGGGVARAGRGRLVGPFGVAVGVDGAQLVGVGRSSRHLAVPVRCSRGARSGSDEGIALAGLFAFSARIG